MKKSMLLIVLLVGFIGCQPVCLGVVNSVAVPERFVGDGNNTTFNFTFRITLQTDLTARLRTDSTGADDPWELNVDYTLAATNNDFSSGGTLTATTAPASGTTLILERDIARTQTVNLQQGQALPAENTETTLDKQTMAIQDIDKDLGFAITVPHGDPTTALTLELPDSVDRADEILVFDSTGNVTTSAFADLSLIAVTEYMETLLDDETALEARGTLELDTTDAVEFAAITGTTGTFSGLVTLNAGATLGAGDDLIGSPTSDITFNTTAFTVAGATGDVGYTGTLTGAIANFSGLVTLNAGATLGAGDDLTGSSTSDITFNTTAFTVAGATGDVGYTGTLTGAIANFSGLITANAGVTLGAGDDLIGSPTSDITFNTDKFTVAGATGDTTIGGTLGVTGVATLGDSSQLATAAAPTVDADIANKKYVDDQIATLFADRGDPASVDLDEAANQDFSNVIDVAGTWGEFNLNTIAGVPTNAKAVLITVAISDGATNGIIQVRDSANSNTLNVSEMRMQVIGNPVSFDLITPITNGIVDMRSSVIKFSEWTLIQMTVKGWWL